MESKLEKAQKILDYVNSSPEEIELCEMRELVRMDIKIARERNIQEGIKIGEKRGIKIGIEKGIKEGIEKGIEKERIKAALLLIKENIPIEKISRITKLSVEKIQKLEQE